MEKHRQLDKQMEYLESQTEEHKFKQNIRKILKRMNGRFQLGQEDKDKSNRNRKMKVLTDC